MESIYSCMGQWLRRMPAFGKKSLAWVYEKDENNKYSCKSEQQSGSLQIIHNYSTMSLAKSLKSLMHLSPEAMHSLREESAWNSCWWNSCWPHQT